MKEATKIIYVFLFAISFLKAQEKSKSERHYPSLMLGVGGTKFIGDVGQLTEVNKLLDARLCYYLKGEYRFGKYFGIMAGGLLGKLAGTDNSKLSHLNFEAKSIQFDVNLVTYFDHFFKQNNEVSPYLTCGIGYLVFESYGDLKKSESNATYNYWSDGSIRDLPELTVNLLSANVITRDYNYETLLKDSSKNYSKSAITIPIGTGLDFKIGRRWDVQLGISYSFILTDYVDNKKLNGNDSYFMAHTGIKFTFAPRIRTPQDNIDFSSIDKLDVDQDGVTDDIDKCLSTDKGVKVDLNGCPEDLDNDGIPDYKDKQLNSKINSVVNEFGVTLNEDSIAYHQMMWDSVPAAKSQKFFQTSTLHFLKKANNIIGSIQNKIDNSKIPNAFIIYDLNNDNYISGQEILKTIDGFFDGNANYTIEKINQLIDYFFDQ